MHQLLGSSTRSPVTMLALFRRQAAPQRFQTAPAERSRHSRYRTEQPPTDIAESILNNPWTAALLHEDAHRPELYCNSTALTRVGLGSWAPDHDAAAVKRAASDCMSAGDPHHNSQQFSQQCDHAVAGRHGSSEKQSCVHDCEQDASKVDSDAGVEQSVGSDEEDASSHSSRAAAELHAGSCSSTSDSTTSDASTKQEKKRAAGDSDSCCEHAEPHLKQPSPTSTNTLAQRQHSRHAVGADSAHAQDDGADMHSNTDAATASPSPNSIDLWRNARSGAQGKGIGGVGPTGATPEGASCKSTCKKPLRQRGFTSWIGDFGHLDGPRFTKEQGRAWQAHMRSHRDHCSDACSHAHSAEEVCKAVFS